MLYSVQKSERNETQVRVISVRHEYLRVHEQRQLQKS
jgi:hypothetical protein